MKKIVIVLGLLLFLFANVSAFAETKVDFIYINGSATNDDAGYEAFHKGINRLHKVLKAYLEKDTFTYEHMLKNGAYVIEDKPSEYFWGFKSKEALDEMNLKSHLLKGVSPIFALALRDIIAGMLHDAIWIKDDYNMFPILMELHEQVLKDAKEGKKVVLLGYSAGSFITADYMLLRTRYVNLKGWLSTQNVSKENMAYVNKNPRKNSCPAALAQSNLAVITPTSNIYANKNDADFREAYKNIDKYTDSYCIPDGTVVGIINYASPIPLFYSGRNNPKTDFYKLAERLFVYAVEHDVFFLTVNFADDPLGFPNDVNYKNEEIAKNVNIKLKKQTGFYYDYSKNISCRTVALAHTSYWNAKERFAKAVVKAYKEGYNFQYGDDNK